MADNRPIGLFDSGVGGLSVLSEIKEMLPQETYIFLADQAHNPYGNKSKKQLETLSARITKYLLSYDIKLMVIACNTATCYALDYLRKTFKIPIIGVVPAIKPATKLSKNLKIAIMSTPATAKSAYLAKLVKLYANNFNVLKLGCDGLEESVEYLNTKNIAKLLDRFVAQIHKFGADVIVLGCTHFPFLKSDIATRLTEHVMILDSGKAIAKRVRDILQTDNSFAANNSPDLFFTTADPKIFADIASTLLKYKIQAQKASI